jgi:hypothetical protein
MGDATDDPPAQIVLGTAHDYAELQVLLRAHVETLNVSREAIDNMAGLPAGYAGKLLAPRPAKTLGWISMGPVLGALGLSLVVVVDPAAKERHTIRMIGRNKTQVRTNVSIAPPPWLYTRQTALNAVKLRLEKLSPAQRRRTAKRAARARWKRHRASVVPSGSARP